MNTEYSYVEVPVAAKEAIEKEGHDRPTASSESHTFAGPGEQVAPNATAPTLQWNFLITPIGTLVLGTILALSHHFFNAWENGNLVTTGIIPQRWVTLIGIVFSFGFKSAVGATMGFVLLQCLWLSVVLQPRTIQEMNIMYRIERQDQLYKMLPRALFFSPTIVAFSVFTLLLPLSGVFAPGSLTVTTQNSAKDAPCKIPTGNLSTLDSPDSVSLFNWDINSGAWTGITPKAMALTTQCLVEQRIPDLPQACGPNCRYTVSVPSFVFQCTPNPPSLPYGQGNGSELDGWDMTFWNGTTDPTSKLAFYVAWQSVPDVPNGTSGNGSCSPVQAQYDIKVETKGGFQFVTTSIKQMTSPIPDYTNFSQATAASTDNALYSFYQLASLSYATKELFLGNITVNTDSTSMAQNLKPPLLDLTFKDGFRSYSWGDVLKGIEEMSRNVTAAILTLSLGTMDATCSYDHQDLVYQYTPFALWVPYDTALGIALISLMVAVMIMARNRTGDITTSFWDTVVLTRSVDGDVSSDAKLRLRTAGGGKLGYTVE